MRFFFILLFFTYSNASGLEKNQPNNQESFFDKNPSEQRNIFINEFKNIFSKNKELQKDTNITVSKLNEIETVESLLIKALELISDGKLDEAGEVTDQLIILAPNFKLAHLIRGDILSAYAMSVENFGGSAVKINSNQVNELKKEAQRRIKGYLSSQNENKLPKFNILPDKKDKAGRKRVTCLSLLGILLFTK